MASKRNLKKEVINLAVALFDDAHLLRTLSTDENAKQLDSIMDEIIVFTDDTIRRVHRPDGKDNPKLVKDYYRALRAYIATKESEFNDRLTTLIEGIQ